MGPSPPQPAPPGTARPATKIYKKGDGIIAVTNNIAKQVIDFLIHSFKKKHICYIDNSMQVMDVRMLREDLSGQEVWQWYHPLSDHLLVKADYRYLNCNA